MGKVCTLSEGDFDRYFLVRGNAAYVFQLHINAHPHTHTHTHTHTPTHPHSLARTSKSPDDKKYYNTIHKQAAKQINEVTGQALQRQFQQSERKKGGETDMGGGVFIPTLVPPKNSALTKHIAAHLYYTNLHSPGMSGAGASRHCKKISDRQKQKAMQTAEENGGLGNHKQDYIMNLAQRIPNDRLLRELCERAYKVKLQRQEVAAAAKNAAIAKTLMTAAKKQQKVQRKQKIDKDAYKLCRMGLTGKTEAMTGHTSRLSSAMRSEGAGDRSGEKQNDKKRKKKRMRAAVLTTMVRMLWLWTLILFPSLGATSTGRRRPSSSKSNDARKKKLVKKKREMTLCLNC